MESALRVRDHKELYYDRERRMYVVDRVWNSPTNFGIKQNYACNGERRMYMVETSLPIAVRQIADWKVGCAQYQGGTKK